MLNHRIAGIFLVLCLTCQLAIAQTPASNHDFQSYLAHIAAANSALRLHEASEAKRWLQATPGSHDTWEWRLLDRQCDTSQRRFKTDEWTPVRVAYSADGNRLALCGDDGVVRVLNSDSLTVELEIRTGQQVVYAARFSPDGKRMATCNRDGNIAVWSTESGDKVWERLTGGEGLADIAIHASGQQIAFCSWFRGPKTVLGLISLWNAETGERTWNSEFGVKPIVVVKFSPDGSKLAAGTWDALVGIWDMKSLDKPPIELNFRDVASYSAIDDIDFSSDGKRIAAASKNASPRIWNLESDKIERDLHGHSSAVLSIAFLANGSKLLSGGSDGVVGMWDTNKGELAQRVFGHENRIASIAVRPGEREAVTCSADHTLRVWSLERTDAFAAAGHSQYSYGTTISRDGKLVAAGGQLPSDVTVWDIATKKPFCTLSGLSGSVNYLDFGPDSLLVGGNWASDLVIWNAGTGERVRTLEKLDLGGIHQCAYSPDGRWVAATARKNQAAIWDAKSGKLVKTLLTESACWGLDFSGDSRRLAVGEDTGNLHVYDSRTWQELMSLPGVKAQINAVKFSPDGKQVACGGENGRLVLFDLASRAAAHTTTAHSQRIWSLDFHPNGTRLATGGADLKVRLWDVASGEMVLTLSDFPEPIYNVEFSPTSDSLIVNAMVVQRSLEISHAVGSRTQ